MAPNDPHSETVPPKSTAWLRWAWIPVLVVGAILRIMYFFEHRTSPFFDGLVLDSANYDELARQLVDGQPFASGVFTYNPLQPLLLAGLYWLFGADVAVPRVALLTADLVGVLGVFFLTRKLAGDVAAIAAGLLAAAYGPSIFYAGELLAEGWVLAFTCGGLALLVNLRDRWWGLLAAGVFLGLACLGRPNMLLFFPALAAWWAYELRDWRPWLRQLVPLGVGVALMIAPFTVRNYVVGGDTVLITAHGGVNLYIGNNPGANGWFRLPKGSGLSGSQKELIVSAEAIAERKAEKALQPSEVSRYWQRQALNFMIEAPGDAFDLFLLKGFYLINAYEKPMVANVYYARQRSVVQGWLTARFGLVMALAIMGMMLGWPERRRLAPLYLFVLTYGVGVVLFFVSMRYRLPMVAGLLPFAGLTVARAIEMARRDRGALAVWGIVGLGVGLVVGWPSIYRQEIAEDMAHTNYYLGGLAFDDGETVRAATYFRRALESDPDNPRYQHRLARAYLANDRVDDAIALLEVLIKEEPRYMPPYLTLGMTYRKAGRLTEAVSTYRAALKRNPRYALAWNNLGNALTDLKRHDDAIEAYQRALKIDPKFGQAARGLARAYDANGQPDKAEAVRQRGP